MKKQEAIQEYTAEKYKKTNKREKTTEYAPFFNKVFCILCIFSPIEILVLCFDVRLFFPRLHLF